MVIGSSIIQLAGMCEYGTIYISSQQDVDAELEVTSIKKENIMDTLNINKEKLVLSKKAAGVIADLSDYLKKIAVTANENKEELVAFDMEFYHKFTDGDAERNECGATACAVGHCAVMMGFIPTVDGVITREQEEDGGWLNWHEFCNQYIDMKPIGTQEESLIWDWFFSGEWSEVDNTPLGVVARINYFLEKNLPRSFVISQSVAKYNLMMVDGYAEQTAALKKELATMH